MDPVTDTARILFVDDEEAILETMMFTFQGDYEVFTSTDARRALEILDEHQPIAAVLTDQKMPEISGVEFVAEVWKRHPETVRMILTGFSDMQAIIEAVNDGHIYAYITKPWEPDQLKQLMKQAVEYHQLSVENERLLAIQQKSNLFLEAVMDHLDTGALAVDDKGLIQAVNQPVRAYLGLDGEIRGRELKTVLASYGLDALGGAAMKIAGDDEVAFDEIEFSVGKQTSRLRITTHNLGDTEDSLGRVILVKEISHEPFSRQFHQIMTGIAECDGALRGEFEAARESLAELQSQVRSSRVDSPGMEELFQNLSRSLTAIGNWLDVDDALVEQEFPDAQVLRDRITVAVSRWPLSGELPERVRALARRVEEYYESGENSRERSL